LFPSDFRLDARPTGAPLPSGVRSRVVRAQIDDHTKDVQYFEKQESAVKDPQLKSFVEQALPVMQQHLQMAWQIEHELPATASSSAPGHR
jgi:predicted outer membrane protein